MVFKVIIASPSRCRHERYRDELEKYDFEVTAVERATDCVNALFDVKPDALVLESNVKWGGADGILDLMSDSPQLAGIPVILICADNNSTGIYQLARFTFQGFINHIPLADELAKSLRQAIKAASLKSMSASAETCVQI